MLLRPVLAEIDIPRVEPEVWIPQEEKEMRIRVGAGDEFDVAVLGEKSSVPEKAFVGDVMETVACEGEI